MSYFVRQYICQSRKKLQAAQIVCKDSVFYVLDMKGNNNTLQNTLVRIVS